MNRLLLALASLVLVASAQNVCRQWDGDPEECNERYPKCVASPDGSRCRRDPKHDKACVTFKSSDDCATKPAHCLWKDSTCLGVPPNFGDFAFSPKVGQTSKNVVKQFALLPPVLSSQTWLMSLSGTGQTGVGLSLLRAWWGEASDWLSVRMGSPNGDTDLSSSEMPFKNRQVKITKIELCVDSNDAPISYMNVYVTGQSYPDQYGDWDSTAKICTTVVVKKGYNVIGFVGGTYDNPDVGEMVSWLQVVQRKRSAKGTVHTADLLGKQWRPPIYDQRGAGEEAWLMDHAPYLAQYVGGGAGATIQSLSVFTSGKQRKIKVSGLELTGLNKNGKSKSWYAGVNKRGRPQTLEDLQDDPLRSLTLCEKKGNVVYVRFLTENGKDAEAGKRSKNSECFRTDVPAGYELTSCLLEMSHSDGNFPDYFECSFSLR